jgi:multiple sugar transport system permease protein
MELSGKFHKIIFVFIVLVLILFPIFWIISTAFKETKDIFSFPPVFLFMPTLKNFVLALTERPILTAIYNSLIVAGIVTIISIIFGVTAGYVLARIRFRGSMLVATGILICRTIPSVILVIPFFLLLNKLGLRDTHLGIILAHLTFSMPLAIWLIWGFIKHVPYELEEAAIVDGFSRLLAIIKIVVPLSIPGISATAILVFLASWNEFLVSLILTSRNARTLPVEIVSFITPVGINWGPMFATGVFIMIPSIIFLFIASRKLIYGLAMGGLKE